MDETIPTSTFTRPDDLHFFMGHFGEAGVIAGTEAAFWGYSGS